MRNKICITTTVKASLLDVLNFVNYHLNIGIDHIYLFFDNPNDNSIDALQNYERVSCFRCDIEHWDKMKKNASLMEKIEYIKGDKKTFCIEERQQLNANYALDIARKDGYDWIVHLDNDELIYSIGHLRKNLEKYDKKYDVLRLLTMEAVPDKLNHKDNMREISLFKNFGAISRFYYKNKKKLKKVFPYFKKNEGSLKVRTMYFNGNAAGKSIVSTRADINNIGMHEPSPKYGKLFSYYYPKNISLLHFECKSFDDWKNKWNKYCKNPADAIEYAGKIPFLKEFMDAYKNRNIEDIKKIYEKFYFIPTYKKIILQLFGLLKKIKLDGKLFISLKVEKDK